MRHRRRCVLMLAVCLLVPLAACDRAARREEEEEAQRQRLLSKQYEGKSLQGWLDQLQQDSFWIRRASAARQLGEIGPEATLAVPHLLEALDDQHAKVRAQAATALSRLAAGSAEVAARLQARLEKEEDDDARAALQQALESLGKVPPAGGAPQNKHEGAAAAGSG